MCKRCLKIRTALFAILLGSAGGALAIWQGFPPKFSMLATFFGAFIPVLWYARKTNQNKMK